MCSSFSTTAFTLVHAWKVWLREYPNPRAKKGYKMQDKMRLADGQNPQPCVFASTHPLHWSAVAVNMRKHCWKQHHCSQALHVRSLLSCTWFCTCWFPQPISQEAELIQPTPISSRDVTAALEMHVFCLGRGGPAGKAANLAVIPLLLSSF